MNDAEWFAEHSKYLASPEWEIKRRRVLERDRWICQAGLPVCDVTAEQVHHLTYRHWRNEPLFDLISVCHSCHEAITEMDRAARPPESQLKPRPVPVWERVALGEESETPMSRMLRKQLGGVDG
jgi:5-methylcytosine-specific restriction endonuclease McrA